MVHPQPEPTRSPRRAGRGRLAAPCRCRARVGAVCSRSCFMVTGERLNWFLVWLVSPSSRRPRCCAAGLSLLRERLLELIERIDDGQHGEDDPVGVPRRGSWSPASGLCRSTSPSREPYDDATAAELVGGVPPAGRGEGVAVGGDELAVDEQLESVVGSARTPLYLASIGCGQAIRTAGFCLVGRPSATCGDARNLWVIWRRLGPDACRVVHDYPRLPLMVAAFGAGRVGGQGCCRHRVAAA